MNPISIAMRRPVTVVVTLLALLGAGALAVARMKVDIFPALNLPVVYVCQPYGGMDPQQMEGLIAYYYEYHFLYIGGIHHVESKNVQGVSLMKLFFHPGTDMAQAMAETVGYVNRSRAFMPPGTVPPFIMRFDTGSVPVGYLVLSSETKTVGQIQDQALNRVRPMFAAIPGVSAPPPFGGSQRTVVVRADPDRLRAYGLSADDVVRALTAGNTVSPSGAIRTADAMPLVASNAMVVRPAELGNIGVRPGVFLRDVAPTIEDATDIPTGYALVNGRRAVYILVTKRADASTVDVVQRVRAELPKMRDVLPPDISVSFEFDQSPYVTNAVKNVVVEGALAAGLVGLMVLLFLRDWRSVIVVVLTIPFAIIAAVIGLALVGQTINLMTLGGLALAVGILVDEATVAVENIHTQMAHTDSLALAVWRGVSDTAVPRLLAMLCILAVFIPSFVMQGAARALFVPLALAVGFAMIASYVLSSTFVPVLAAWLLRNRAGHADHGPTRGGRLFASALRHVVRGRWLVVPAYLAAATLLVAVIGSRLGTEIFPQVDAGQFQLRLRGPAGTRIEQTEALTREALALISREVGADNVAISLGYVGVVPPSYPINSVYLWTGGPEEAVVRVAFRRGAVRIDELKQRLREQLPGHLRDWLARKWRDEGVPAEQVARTGELQLSFEPADIVNEVMSFGSPTPIEVVVSSPKLADSRAHADKVYAALAAVPTLRDLQYGQSLDYPTVQVAFDRERAAYAGVSAEDFARSLVAATSSSRFTVPNYWLDPAVGIGYQVQVEIPQARMASAADVEAVPVKQNGGAAVLLRDVARVGFGSMPGELDRYNMRRLVSLTANVEGEDLGRAAARVRRAVADAGAPPPGVQVDVRGQVAPLQDMSDGLLFGLLVAVAVIVLLLMAYFQSPRLALVSVAAVPAVLAGVVVALWLTRTTLNVQSFMGAIMAVGVAVANAILLVTFAERERLNGRTAAEAGAAGAVGRTRAILMTSLAMTAGMVPMALGLGDGGDQTAPLGRAVIGGLAAATVATLTMLPAVFALVMGRASTISASLDPHDPGSRRYVPAAAVLLFAWVLCGCRGAQPPAAKPEVKAAAPAEVKMVHPERRPFRLVVEQPGAIGPYEETQLFAKLAGFVRRVNVNIGDRVKGPVFDASGRETQSGQVLAEIALPELEEEAAQKQALVRHADAETEQARRAFAVAESAVAAAAAFTAEARAGLTRAQALYERWQSEADRVAGLVQRGVIDSATRDETINQFRSAQAGRDEAQARIATAEAAVAKAQAGRDKAAADVRVAEARAEVARADARRLAALLTYAAVRAPYDGVVTRRAVNPGDFLQPAAARGGIFTVTRLDPVRIAVTVPEADAGWVDAGADVTITVQALGEDLTARLTRTSWALDPATRTLRAEIDLPNAGGRLRPGMYVSARIFGASTPVWAVPASAVAGRGESATVFRVVDGRATRVPVRLGRSDATWVEVREWRPAGASGWLPLSAKDQLVYPAARVSEGLAVAVP